MSNNSSPLHNKVEMWKLVIIWLCFLKCMYMYDVKRLSEGRRLQAKFKEHIHRSVQKKECKFEENDEWHSTARLDYGGQFPTTLHWSVVKTTRLHEAHWVIWLAGRLSGHIPWKSTREPEEGSHPSASWRQRTVEVCRDLLSRMGNLTTLINHEDIWKTFCVVHSCRPLFRIKKKNEIH